MLGIYITAGYPNYGASLKALEILDDSGVDLIELGVPFSDPLADGPVIQKAAHQALSQGMNLNKVFDLIVEAKASRANSKSHKGLNNLILFSYYNPLYVYGFDRVIQKCLETGIQGALIPDLPVDEAEELVSKFQAAGLNLVLLAAITSTDERLEKIAKLSNPFIYLVSRVGTTGSSQDISDLKSGNEGEEALLIQVLNKLKSYTSKPIGLGFGIDSRAKVSAAYKTGAQMAIIGSKAIQVLENDKTENLSEFKNFILELGLAEQSCATKK